MTEQAASEYHSAPGAEGVVAPAPAPGSRAPRDLLLPAAAGVAVTLATGMAFLYAPTEAVQGEVQRIFYVHVPSAWVAYLAFFVTAAASVLVLARPARWPVWDRVAVSSCEAGLLFTSVVLLSGPIWAHRAWGVWWSWDARLTSTLVLWLVYAGYLAFRSLSAPGERRARLCAVVGVVGAVDIPIVHFAVDWWTTAHPPATVLNFEGGPTLPGSMLATLVVGLAAYTLLYAAIVTVRMRIERARLRLEELGG